MSARRLRSSTVSVEQRHRRDGPNPDQTVADKVTACVLWR